MMEQFTRRHFFNHGKPGLEAEKAACHWCQLRSFPTHGTIPVSIVNEINDDTLPENFQFVNSMVLRDGVTAAEDSFRSGCSCDDAGHGCQFGGCSCLEDVEEAAGTPHDATSGSIGREAGQSDDLVYSYYSNGRNAGLLRHKFTDSTDPLYECHESCACSRSCPNRVVERGRTVPLQIFRTTDRGWGVRSPETIKKGQFVDCYIGEVITPEEADRRREASDKASHKDIYLFALDKFSDPDSHDPRLTARPLEVDGEFMSGPARFVNHSCDPNMRIFARVGDHADKHLHDLALFAVKEIPKGEELTFDYVDGVADDNDEHIDPSKMMKCLCGSPKCRQYLW